MKTVSVVMPCYNDGEYIEQAVASLRAQTYSDIELIVVDDGSDDVQTVRIIRDLSFPCVKRLCTPHSGPAFARNAGIAAAQGEYILPLDADDTIDPSYIARAVSILEENTEIGIVYCQASFFGKKTGRWLLPPYSLKEMLIGNIIFASALFRKVDWEKVGGYNPNMKYGLEDYDFWLSLLENGAEIYQIQEVLFHYRIKPVSRSSAMQKSMDMLKAAYRQVYLNHKAFYTSHHELYTDALRERVLCQADDIEKLQEVIRLHENKRTFSKVLKKVPGISFFLKRITRLKASHE